MEGSDLATQFISKYGASMVPVGMLTYPAVKGLRILTQPWEKKAWFGALKYWLPLLVAALIAGIGGYLWAGLFPGEGFGGRIFLGSIAGSYMLVIHGSGRNAIAKRSVQPKDQMEPAPALAPTPDPDSEK